MESNTVTLIKRPESFKLTISEALETKIRRLCDKLPNNEYSGTLFYRIQGSFTKQDLHIIAEDFYLQDIGSCTYTEFNNDPTLAGYMLDNDLITCHQGLMHSHDTMPTFFSGTDLNTLRSEGADANHFVSLIVNNAGDYTAAITRKVKRVLEGKVTLDYSTFNNKAVSETEENYSEEETVIEYFMLKIDKPVIENSLGELDKRIEDLKTKKKTVFTYPSKASDLYPSSNLYPSYNYNCTESPYSTKQVTLFDNYEEEEEKTPTAIKNIAVQIITGDLFGHLKSNINPKKWVENMENTYNRRFKDFDSFKYMADLFMEGLIEDYVDNYNGKLDPNDTDSIRDVCIFQLQKELDQYTPNKYLDYYLEILNKFIV